jgi:hypothetical protein
MYICNNRCYDMEVGENRVRVFYGTEKREKVRPVTCLRHMYTSNNRVEMY